MVNHKRELWLCYSSFSAAVRGKLKPVKIQKMVKILARGLI